MMPSQPNSSDAPIRLLLVEDEFVIRMTLAETLADAGYDVLEAETGAEALALLTVDSSIRLLLTDIQLPGGVSGLHLAEQARAGRPTLQVIYMTGRPDTMPEMATHPADTVIAKPYLPSEVAATVRRLTA